MSMPSMHCLPMCPPPALDATAATATSAEARFRLEVGAPLVFLPVTQMGNEYTAVKCYERTKASITLDDCSRFSALIQDFLAAALGFLAL